VEADPGQIGQVFQNLVINAIQAMPTGGTIEVSGANTVVEAGGSLPLAPGNYVKISFKDEGMGIPNEYLSKIFDPYFTTKQTGSGLGLATAFSIIKNHQGHITADSRLGRGTTFRIYLPAAGPTIMEALESDREVLQGQGNILVMDDDKLVRQLLGVMLSRLGFDAEFAGNGEEAIKKFKKAQRSGHPFDAVILDLTIPGGMGGKETIKYLRQLDPGVKAIVSSGYSDDQVLAEFAAHGFDGIIAKPYTISEVSAALNALLNKC
jgi:CheY-like chemotaxis protein